MVGTELGKWTIVENAGRDAKSNVLVKCRCQCGIEKIHALNTLKRGLSTQCKSCRMKLLNKYEEIVGKTFGNWTVLKRVENKNDEARYQCKCNCGFVKDVTGYRLKNGESKSCQHCRVKKHGMAYSSTYSIWSGLFRRCYNPKFRAYKHYGARGIIVCDRWNKFENFLEDMGIRPSGLSIDRINNDGNYEPSNCRWATNKEQAANQRRVKDKVILGGI